MGAVVQPRRPVPPAARRSGEEAELARVERLLVQRVHALAQRVLERVEEGAAEGERDAPHDVLGARAVAVPVLHHRQPQPGHHHADAHQACGALPLPHQQPREEGLAGAQGATRPLEGAQGAHKASGHAKPPAGAGGSRASSSARSRQAGYWVHGELRSCGGGALLEQGSRPLRPAGVRSTR